MARSIIVSGQEAVLLVLRSSLILLRFFCNMLCR